MAPRRQHAWVALKHGGKHRLEEEERSGWPGRGPGRVSCCQTTQAQDYSALITTTLLHILNHLIEETLHFTEGKNKGARIHCLPGVLLQPRLKPKLDPIAQNSRLASPASS